MRRAVYARWFGEGKKSFWSEKRLDDERCVNLYNLGFYLAVGNAAFFTLIHSPKVMLTNVLIKHSSRLKLVE